MKSPRTETILREAVVWMEFRVRGKEVEPEKNSDSSRFTWSRKKAEVLMVQRVRLNRAQTTRVAQKHLDENSHLRSEISDLDQLMKEICGEWGKPDAAELAQKWLKGEAGVIDLEISQSELNVVVGLAVAAAVLAVILLVRRGQGTRAGKYEFSPSDDFKDLLQVADGGDEAAAIAKKIRDSCMEPWSWTLKEGAKGLEVQETRQLLLSFSSQALCRISTVSARAGERLDTRTMEANVKTNEDDVFLVLRDTTNQTCGFKISDEVWVRAKVEVCTADWWVLSQPKCPVFQVVREKIEELLPGGPDRAKLWRASWGFTYPEDLRELSEETLNTWRNRLIEELNPFYNGMPDRMLRLLGVPNQVFDSSMETESGEEPSGDHVVTASVERDGVPQYGLGCEGGSPLLTAVVRVKQATRGL